MKENPICPNCGSAKIKISKVRKLNSNESKDIPLKEFVEKQQKPQQYGFEIVMSGDISFVTYIQSVFQCEDCGYTLTKDF